MSTAALPRRYALGLPSGSVRATHLLAVVLLVVLVLLLPARSVLPIPPYLVYLLFLVLGAYFAHRGANPTPAGQTPPLGLPRGSVRFLAMTALVGAIGWKAYSDPEGLRRQYEATLDAMKGEPLLPLVVLGGFLVGVIVRALAGREHPPRWLQDFEAWISILALVGLGAAAVIELIRASMENPIALPGWEGFLSGLVAFYFGART